MKHFYTLLVSSIFALTLFAHNPTNFKENFVVGSVDASSMSVLSFGPEGILFIGDSKAGQIIALDMNDMMKNESEEGFKLEKVDAKVASLLGLRPNEVIIHDMAVNPISQNIYLSVSRANAQDIGRWVQPNDLAYAQILMKISPAGDISEVDLSNINHSRMALPNVIAEGDSTWRKSDKRTEAITDIAYDDGSLYVSGLSNEEFASMVRVLSFPFSEESNNYSTIEVWHIAHAKNETESPIRTLLPYQINGEKHLLASYTCTPFVTIPVDDLKKGAHVKSNTIAEFGFGNMPIDLIQYTIDGKEFLLMSNTSKALIRMDPEKIAAQETITRKMEDFEYTVGLPHDVLSKVAVTQIDNYGSGHVLLLQRSPNGDLNLQTYPNKWL